MNTKFLRLNTVDNLLLQGLLYSPEEKTEKVLLHIHGMGGNFYENIFVDSMAEGLTKAGYAFMSINTRGHDIVSFFPVVGSKEDYKRVGNAYEKFEECLIDIKPAIDYLAENFREIILCGHSLGSAKVAFYIAKTKDSRVQKLILMSPPDMVSLFDDETRSGLLSEAQGLISENKGDQFLSKMIWDWYPLSAKTYIDLSEKDNPVDIFNLYDKEKPSLLSEINIPVFAFMGETDDAVNIPQEEALEIIKNKAKNAPIFDIKIIEGTGHSYFNKGKEMTVEIIKWLAK